MGERLSKEKIADRDIDKIISKEKITEKDVDVMAKWVIDICEEIQKNGKDSKVCEGCGCDPCDCNWGN